MRYTLITGACGGLGRAYVEVCAKRKWNMILTGTSRKKLDSLLEEFKDKLEGLSVKTLVLDLGDKASREKLIESIKAEGLDVERLIGNAGIIQEGDMERFSDEEISAVVEVNCVGTLDLTKKLLRERDSEQPFEVLTVASVAGSYPIPHMAVYAASKAFLVSMMTSLAIEFKGKNVTFTTVCPGGMATNDNMKESIKSMGLGGKLSSASTTYVAEVSLKALKKKKTLVTPGAFNKFLGFVSKFPSKKFLARNAGKIWAKSQAKRNF